MIEVENFLLTNALIVIDYFIDGRYKAESFPIESFQLFIESNNYLEYHNFKQKHDGQYDEVEGQVTWEKYLSEFVTNSDVLDFLKNQLETKWDDLDGGA